MEEETRIPKFLKFVTGLTVEQDINKFVDQSVIDGLPPVFSSKETTVINLDTDPSAKRHNSVTTKECLAKFPESVNLDSVLSRIEEKLTNDLIGHSIADFTTKVDVSSSYRRKKDVLDKRRKMALEANDNELLELLDGNQMNMIVELDKEMLLQIGELFSKMMLESYDYVIVSPEMATVLKELSIFNVEKPDLINITTVVPEGTISNIRVFTNMMTPPKHKWNMYFSSSSSRRETMSIQGNLIYTRTVDIDRLYKVSVITVIGADVERKMAKFAPGLAEYTLTPVKDGDSIIGMAFGVKPGEPLKEGVYYGKYPGGRQQ